MAKEFHYLVSACLCGIPCRYNGKTATDKDVQRVVKTGKAIPICPEVLGGLPVPRSRVDIARGEGKDVLSGSAPVLSQEGIDLSPFLLRGAFASLQIARKFKIKKAWLKQNSPSCGCGWIKRKGKLVKGDGVTAALFKREGIKVVP
ncbi:MAG: DUF523 domain-containing protein, partial [candidate division Zixibacteria bacterium]|nr:DUF523 domain-containing protein [candidate division Zixibacteria bacterium]